MFRTAAGATREDKERNACIGAGCEKYPTKIRFKQTIQIEQTLEEIEVSWLENKSGYGRKLAELTPLQFDGLILWQDAVERYTARQIPDLQEIYLASKGIKK